MAAWSTPCSIGWVAVNCKRCGVFAGEVSAEELMGGERHGRTQTHTLLPVTH